MNGGSPVPTRSQLAGLVFELASQLHVERAHRLALQAALEKAGFVDSASLQALASDPALQRHSHETLEESIAKLMRVLMENADPRRPLRDDEGGNKTGGARS